MELRNEIQAEIDQAIAQAKINHQAELDQLTANHQAELNQLRAEHDQRVAQAVRETEEAALAAFKSGLRTL